MTTEILSELSGTEIAIIGLAVRLPQAENVEQYWQNLCASLEAITPVSDAAFQAVGADPALLKKPNFIRVAAYPDNIEHFDADFFGFSPREAELTDPQQRLLLECAWEALEDAGYSPGTYQGRVGVFAGTSLSTYLTHHLCTRPDLLSEIDPLQIGLGNSGDYVATRLAYKFNLTGPSFTVQCACSTSLVAVHLACQSLLNEECDMALAGAVNLNMSQRGGYQYLEGAMVSPDGHCRAFDAEAQGTVFGNGGGSIVLKRLQDALADGDQIYAVIKGSAINNDGANKVGFMAPSVDLQADVIAEALAVADVSADTISYIETHGTGTALGDPIEVQALTKAFRADTDASGFCAIGSVKPNIGHLDVASGVAGLTKAALALKHRRIPASINFTRPNPNIDFASSPFYVNTELRDWPAGPTPRRAGVTALGFGGTNAHLILEEAPQVSADESRRPYHLLVLSAQTQSALDRATERLADQLERRPEQPLADIAYTLQVGRKPLACRRIAVCATHDEAIAVLRDHDSRRVASGLSEGRKRSITFLFPGQGAQTLDMGRDLYESEPVFRQTVDHCAAVLAPHLDQDLRTILYPAEAEREHAARLLSQTWLTQPALFVVEYALAQLLRSWGIEPSAMLGHSIGEYVAACVAGVFTLEDALALVAARGRLMQSLPPGAMVAVPLPETELLPLPSELSLAALNGPTQCVVAGPIPAIEQFVEQMAARGVSCRRLETSHAFHSSMMDPIVERFRQEFAGLRLQPPQIPLLSNVTGTWMTEADAVDPGYWARQLREAVRLADGAAELLQDQRRIYLELGPGQTLSRLVKRHPQWPHDSLALPTLTSDLESAAASVLRAVGEAWVAGAELNWTQIYRQERRRRVSLPTYPFERQRYWIEPLPRTAAATPVQIKPSALEKQPDLADWFYVPTWQRSIPDQVPPATLLAKRRSRWLILRDDQRLGAALAERLRSLGQEVVTADAGSRFSQQDARSYTFDPGAKDDYERLIQGLAQSGNLPDVIVHLLNVSPDDQISSTWPQERSFYSLLFLTQALGKWQGKQQLKIGVISTNLQDVTGDETLIPEKATLLGMCRSIPQEYSAIRCQSIDIMLPKAGSRQEAQLLDRLIVELAGATSELIVAYRGAYRWTQSFEQLRLNESPASLPLARNGVYLITGGLGGIGLELAEYLASKAQARLILVGRSALPPRETWEAQLRSTSESDSLHQKLRKLQAIESLGAQIQTYSADVADAEQMRQVVADAERRFGPIQGVIHAAGIAVGGLISLKQPADVERVFAPKIAGTRILEQLIDPARLDFFVLCSSIGSVLGDLAQGDYCAANAFLDSFAHYHRATHGTRTIAINWDMWREVGMAVNLRAAAGLQHQGGVSADGFNVLDRMLDSRLSKGITPAEGVAAFDRILSSSLPQIAVSARHLPSVIAHAEHVTLAVVLDQIKQETTPKDGPQRSAQRKAYVPPSSEIEHTIAGIWQKALGVERVGAMDNFFELGGDSLVAIHIAAQLKEALGMEVPMSILYESPTIQSLSRALAPADADQTGPETSDPSQYEERRRRRDSYQQKERARRQSRVD